MNIPAYVIWLAAAILFGILEAVMLGLNSIWFSVGALAAMAAALLGGGVPAVALEIMRCKVILPADQSASASRPPGPGLRCPGEPDGCRPCR